MPLLTIQGLPGPPLEVPAGATVLAAIHAAGHAWWHACGAKGRCTTCRVRLLAGAELLTPPTAPELAYRAAGRLGPTERLACQARVATGIKSPAAGVVELGSEAAPRQYAPALASHRRAVPYFVGEARVFGGQQLSAPLPGQPSNSSRILFTEPRRYPDFPRRRGWLEVICGSMFSGKTEELIRRLTRARIARQRVEIFKPALDTRYHAQDVVSHNQTSIRSTPVQSPSEILLLAGGSTDVVGIDEAQFFDESLVDVCRQLADQGIRVIVAGLDMDYLGRPFGPMPALLATAEFVTKVHAVCVCCGELAAYSYRIVASENQVVLGETDAYEARCRPCFLAGEAAHAHRAEASQRAAH